MNNDGQYYSEIISVRMIVEFYYDSSFNYFSFFFSTYWSDKLYLFALVCSSAVLLLLYIWLVMLHLTQLLWLFYFSCQILIFSLKLSN